MDNCENWAAASFEVRAVDDVTVSVEGYVAVFNQETVIGGRIFLGRRKLQDDLADVARLPTAWRARC